MEEKLIETCRRLKELFEGNSRILEKIKIHIAGEIGNAEEEINK